MNFGQGNHGFGFVSGFCFSCFLSFEDVEICHFCGNLQNVAVRINVLFPAAVFKAYVFSVDVFDNFSVNNSIVLELYECCSHLRYRIIAEDKHYDKQ